MGDIWQAAVFANRSLQILYHEGLFMEPSKAALVAENGLMFIRTFGKLATRSLELKLPRFQLVPKIHIWAHVVHELKQAASFSHPVLNPLAYSCQCDEDFVGKICALSRATHARTLHHKTLQKYRLNLALRW